MPAEPNEEAYPRQDETVECDLDEQISIFEDGVEHSAAPRMMGEMVCSAPKLRAEVVCLTPEIRGEVVWSDPKMRGRWYVRPLK